MSTSYSDFSFHSSQEAMIEGVLRHCTEMEIEKNYVDTHGQSEVGFAFSLDLHERLPGLPDRRTGYSDLQLEH